VEEEETDGDFSRDWRKSTTTAIVAPGGRYRFEVHGPWEWWVQASDGKTERLFSPSVQEYIEKPSSAMGPARFQSSSFVAFIKLTNAQDTLRSLSELSGSVRSATYLPDETITLNDEHVECYVIKAEGKYLPGDSPDTKSESIFWIDKQKHLVRKVRNRIEGELLMGSPQEHYVRDTTTIYTLSALDPPSLADSLFALNLPSSAKLVKEFRRSLGPNTIVGNPAPEVILHTTEGKSVSLASFRGKPVLLDFWATWCAPCVASFPILERLYSEVKSKGLVMLGIDEDDDPLKASQFLAEHKEPWPNFHDDGEVARLFPNQGIPHFVLIDSNGTVVYSKSAFEESELRTAIAKLGPEFLAVSPKY
jgi:thiol-disulfide isomerase/thioredoxin